MTYANSKTDIDAAALRVRPLVPKSPLAHFHALSEIVGTDVYCKLDTPCQRAHSKYVAQQAH